MLRRCRNVPENRKEEIEIREEANDRYPKVKYLDPKIEKEMLMEFEKFEKEEENRILERIEMKKRYIREQFLGDYPVGKVEKEFIYNTKCTLSFDQAIVYVFIDFKI